MGIKSAKYEVLLLTDADCIPSSEHWIKKMQAAFHSGIEIVLGYGAYKKDKGVLLSHPTVLHHKEKSYKKVWNRHCSLKRLLLYT